jgi:hypothetical protein
VLLSTERFNWFSPGKTGAVAQRSALPGAP